MIYYIGDVPVSDELYHHGTKGQKWGVRRYQNADGTYTALGKLRKASARAGAAAKIALKSTGKAVAAAGRATGKAVGVLAKHQIDKIKRNHIWMMSDSELQDYTKRLAQEKTLKDAMKSNSYSRGKELVRNILEKGANTLANKAFEALGNKIVDNSRLRDDLKYSKKMAKRTAKNKLLIDKTVDKGQKKQTKNDPSSRIAKDIMKNYETMSDDERSKKMKKYKDLKEIENRYRGASNPTSYYSSRKG